MAKLLSRRALLAGSMMAPPRTPVIDTHIHLFAGGDPRFPYHANATYRPPASTLEDYSKFVRAAKIDHTIIVHPEPYQDDHRYLEYAFEHEPSPGFFKGTCLFDPIARETPRRMAALVKKWPRRIVALRIHTMRQAGVPPSTSGAIKDRDLRHPAVRDTVHAATELGLGIQMHFIPANAREIHALMDGFPATPVILDHLGRPEQGTPAQYEDVLRLARLPRAVMKYSGWSYIPDPGPVVKRVYATFGAKRMIWGGLGMNMAEFERSRALLDRLFAFAPEAERRLIRGENASRLFGFAG